MAGFLRALGQGALALARAFADASLRQLTEQALGHDGELDPDELEALHDSAVAGFRSWLSTHNLNTLRYALRCQERAAYGVPQAWTNDRCLFLSNLRMLQGEMYRASGDTAYLDASVTSAEMALEVAMEANDKTLTNRYSGLSDSLRERFEARGDPADADRAVAVARTALAEADHERLSRRVEGRSQLPMKGHIENFTERRPDLMTGLFSDDRTTPAITAKGFALFVLSKALSFRFQKFKDSDDLRETILRSREAIHIFPVGHPGVGVCRGLLAIALQEQFRLSGNIQDIDESLDLLRVDVDEQVVDPTESARRHNNLAAGLVERSRANPRRADLDEALVHFEQALSLIPTHLSGERALAINALAAVHSYRYTQFHERADLDVAIRYAEVVLEALPSWSSDYPRIQTELATRIMARITRHDGGFDGDGKRARALFYEVESHPAATAQVRYVASAMLGFLFGQDQDIDRASEAFGRALDQLDQVANLRLTVEDRLLQLDHLEQAGVKLGPLAATIAIARGSIDEAVRILERSRAVILAQAVDPDAALGGLRADHEELAAQLDDLRRRFTDGLLGREDDVTPNLRQARSHLVARWDQLLREIREKDGYEQFMRGPSSSELRKCAAQGPVVLLFSDEHCHAIILTTKGALHLPLPQFSTEDAVSCRTALRQAVEANDWNTNSTIIQVLETLWTDLAEPVLSLLLAKSLIEPAIDNKPQSRIWWVPTGPLDGLPIHAAQSRSTGGPSHGVMDCVVSSYAVTIAMLNRARQGKSVSFNPEFTTILSAPQVDGLPDLGHARREATEVATLLSSPGTTPNDSENTHCTPADVIRSSQSVHFACHAVTDQKNPAESHLRLGTDERLTVRQVSAVTNRDAFLAYLSACSTAHDEVRLVDEALHISAAFNVAGFPHVVGTLWPIPDESGPMVAPQFYRRLLDDRANVSGALASALAEVRDRYPDTPILWAPYVHVGA